MMLQGSSGPMVVTSEMPQIEKRGWAFVGLHQIVTGHGSPGRECNLKEAVPCDG